MGVELGSEMHSKFRKGWAQWPPLLLLKYLQCSWIEIFHAVCIWNRYSYNSLFTWDPILPFTCCMLLWALGWGEGIEISVGFVVPPWMYASLDLLVHGDSWRLIRVEIGSWDVQLPLKSSPPTPACSAPCPDLPMILPWSALAANLPVMMGDSSVGCYHRHAASGQFSWWSQVYQTAEWLSHHQPRTYTEGLLDLSVSSPARIGPLIVEEIWVCVTVPTIWEGTINIE